MNQFGKIFKFELKYYLKNKVFVGITVFLVLLMAFIMFIPRITESVDTDTADNSAEELAVMLVKSNDTAQADMVKELFSAVSLKPRQMG